MQFWAARAVCYHAPTAMLRPASGVLRERSRVLFIVKLTLTPILVGLMSLAARKWGPTIGGLITGLPWMTGPILLFFALDNGEAFAATVAIGVELGAAAIGAYALVYSTLARVAPWPLCLAAAVVAYFATGWLLTELPLDLYQAAALGYAGLFTAFALIPAPRTPDAPRGLPWWDIPVRMLATFVLVAAITFSSERLGARLSGVVATYPVIITVVAAFTHHQWGAAAAVRLLRAVMLSLMAFVTFFLVMGATIAWLGIVPAFALAIGSALAVSSLVLALVRSKVLPT